MARVLFNNVWFTSVLSQTWYESDFERLVISRCADLFPWWKCVPFKADVVGEDGSTKRPDLALIDPAYRTWWVVEVELAHHNLLTHVLPQVEAFRTASYNRGHAEILHRKSPSLDLERLTDMMLGLPPDVLVIVDRPDTDWGLTLRSRNVYLSIVEPFRDQGDNLLIRVNGHQPAPPSSALTRCTRHVVRRLWKVHSPAALPPAKDGADVLEIEFDGAVSTWKQVRLADGLMLFAERGEVLVGWRAVDLVRREDGILTFQPIARE